MAKRRKNAEVAKADPLETISRLLALIAIKGVEKDEAALQLSGAGMDDKAIGDVLGVGPSYMRVVRFRNKRKR